MVSPDQQFHCHGQVTRWRYIGRTSNPFRAIVWRPANNAPNTTFEIVGINKIPAGAVNEQVSYGVPQSDRITVKPGDLIGWTYITPVIKYNVGGTHRVHWIGGNKYASLKVKQQHNFSANVQEREYSIQAIVGEPGSSNLVELGIVGEKPITTKSFDISDLDIMDTNYIGISTGYKSQGNWTICSYLPSATYKGCYIDTKDRALPNYQQSSSGMTIESCLAHCRSVGLMRYASVQNGDTCFCDGEFSVYFKHGRAPETECNMSCAGDKDQMCGGSLRNAVYDLGDPTNIRLMYGGNSYSGRIELYHNGEWSTICGRGWDVADADVACRSIGYLGAKSFKTYPKFGKGSGNILMGDISCTGAENSLFECGHSEFYKLLGCSHDEDVGVICQDWEERDTTSHWWIVVLIILAVLLILIILHTLYRKSVLQSRLNRTVSFVETLQITYSCCCPGQYSSVASPRSVPATTPNAAAVSNANSAGGANGPPSQPGTEPPPLYDESQKQEADDTKV